MCSGWDLCEKQEAGMHANQKLVDAGIDFVRRDHLRVGEQLIRDISTRWSELFTAGGILRDSHVFTQTRPRCWGENWGSRGWGGHARQCLSTRATLFFFLATQGEERSPKAREPSWDNQTTTQAGNISSYFGFGPVVHPTPATWSPMLFILSLASVLVLAFKAVNGLTPTYLSELLHVQH